MEKVIERRGAVIALTHGLAHQFMCAAVMAGGHVAANYSDVAMRVVMHPATNVAMMGVAAWCWWRGDKDWRARREHVASPFEKASSRFLIAAASIGMMAMHIPGGHHHIPSHSQAESSAWFQNQTKAEQDALRENARALGIPLPQYINDICGNSPK